MDRHLLPKERYSYYENRNLSAFPEISVESIANGKVFGELETMFCDYAAWRTAALVTRDKDGKVLHAEKKENPDDGWNKLMPGTYGKNLYRHYVETPLPPSDAKWKQLYKDNRGTAFSIDTNSLRYKNGYADLWLAVTLPDQEKDLSQIIYRVRINMAYKKVMTLSATEYNAAGKIRLHAAAEGAKENIPNDSPVEKVFEYLKDEIDSGRL